MKKIFYFAILAVFTMGVVSSCKVQEPKCPAYSMEMPQNVKHLSDINS